MKHSFFALFIFTCLIHVSCEQQVGAFEKNTTIPSHNWKMSFPATGNFTITDTLSGYNIFIVLRHTDAYKYNNIWLNVGLKSPGDSLQFQKVNLILGDDSKGWQGTGMNDIWEVRKQLNNQPRRFIKSGEYSFDIRQIMRDDPLPGIISAGFRVEKAVAVKKN